MISNVRNPLLRGRGFFFFLILALLIGGGGAEGGRPNALLVLAGSVLFTFAITAWAIPRAMAGIRGTIVLVVALGLLAIPIFQLVPLPPSIWHGLAGRDAALPALSLVSAESAWRPLSMNPIGTATSFSFLLLPIALFLMAANADDAWRYKAMLAVVAVAMVSGVIGAAQLALGSPEFLAFYDAPSFGAAAGLFANPNHQALLMSSAAVIAASFASRRRGLDKARAGASPYPTWAYMALSAFFALMTLAAGARAGVLLLALAIPASLVLAIGNQSIFKWLGVVAAVSGVLLLVVLMYPGTNSLGLRESLRFGEDVRYAYLPDILYTLDQYWSSGSGLGSFVTVFTPNENLDLMGRAYLNHAHNDLFEWLIETGLPGLLWLGVASLTLLWSVLTKARNGKSDLSGVICSLVVLLLAAIHSLADYPLRTETMAMVVALAAGSIVALPPVEQRTTPRWLLIIALLVSIPLGLQGLRLHLAQYAARHENMNALTALLPQHPAALIAQSAAALEARNPDLALNWASQAVKAAPLSQAAVRQLALSLEAKGKSPSSAWRVASALGWRDPATQLWAFRQAISGKEWGIAALRAGAVMRGTDMPPELLKIIRSAAQSPEFAAELARRTQISPPWRSRFFAVSTDATDAEVLGLREVLKQMVRMRAVQRSDVRGVIDRLVSKKDWAPAFELYSVVAPAKAGLLSDGGFDRTSDDYTQSSTAFDWRAASSPHASGVIETAPPSRLVADSDGESKAMVASRILILTSGRYTLSLQGRSDTDGAFEISIVCLEDNKSLLTEIISKSSNFVTHVGEFEVPSGCPATKLMINALPIGTPSTSELDNFRLES